MRQDIKKVNAVEACNKFEKGENLSEAEAVAVMCYRCTRTCEETKCILNDDGPLIYLMQGGCLCCDPEPSECERDCPFRKFQDVWRKLPILQK